MNKKILIIGISVVIIVGTLLAVWIVQQQTSQRIKAAPSTTISFSPISQTIGIGQSVNADIILDPGQNQISILKLVLTYDGSLFATADASLTPLLVKDDIDAEGFTQIIESPITDRCIETVCTMSVTVSIGNNPAKSITKPLKIATISLKAKTATGESSAEIHVADTSEVFSIGSEDQTNENVLQFASLVPLLVTIRTTPVTPTPDICVTDKATCQWDAVAGVVKYHYIITDTATGGVLQEGDVDEVTTSVVFPSVAGKTYTCVVTATNVCDATSKAGAATQTCQVIITPTPTRPVTPTPTACPTPGTVKNLRMICPNCPAQ